MSQSGQRREKKGDRVLSREQQAIWRKENRTSMKGKSKDEKKAAREKMMSQLKAMSEGDRAKLITDLQSKWDALPQAEKDALKKKKEGGRKGGGKRKGKKAAAHDEDDD